MEQRNFLYEKYKNYKPEHFDYFALFKNELPEIIDAKFKELKPIVKDQSAVLVMADNKMKTIRHWFWRLMFKIWVYDKVNESFQTTYKELKRFYWLNRRLKGAINPQKMTILEFKEQNPVYDNIERYVPINSRGFAKCPFHKNGNERTPSLKVYKDSWYCFSCNENGDVLNFLTKIQKITIGEI